MGHYVYKYVYNGEIVYIGKNDTDLISRINQHKREKKFQPYLSSEIYYIALENRTENKVMESLLINRYKPLLNVSEKYDGFGLNIIFDEPKWVRYFEADFETKKVTNNNYKEGVLKRREAALRRREEKLKRKLELMLNHLRYYYYIRDYNFELIDGEAYIRMPAEDFYNVPMSFSIENKKHWSGYGLLRCGTLEEGDGVCKFKVDEEHYQIFVDNFDTIISQYKKEIAEFANENVLECSI